MVSSSLSICLVTIIFVLAISIHLHYSIYISNLSMVYNVWPLLFFYIPDLSLFTFLISNTRIKLVQKKYKKTRYKYKYSFKYNRNIETCSGIQYGYAYIYKYSHTEMHAYIHKGSIFYSNL